MSALCNGLEVHYTADGPEEWACLGCPGCVEEAS